MFGSVIYLMYVTVRIYYTLSAATAVGVGRNYTGYNTIEEWKKTDTILFLTRSSQKWWKKSHFKTKKNHTIQKHLL